MRIHVPKTVQFDTSLPYTEINGYKFHTEVFGETDKPAVIIVHGGPGQGCDYMYALRELSHEHRIIFMTNEAPVYHPGWPNNISRSSKTFKIWIK